MVSAGEGQDPFKDGYTGSLHGVTDTTLRAQAATFHNMCGLQAAPYQTHGIIGEREGASLQEACSAQPRTGCGTPGLCKEDSEWVR